MTPIEPPAVTLAVTEARERLENSLRDIRNIAATLGRDLSDLHIYARERADDVRGHYQSTEASNAYNDMADRIAALLGPTSLHNREVHAGPEMHAGETMDEWLEDHRPKVPPGM